MVDNWETYGLDYTKSWEAERQAEVATMNYGYVDKGYSTLNQGDDFDKFVQNNKGYSNAGGAYSMLFLSIPLDMTYGDRIWIDMNTIAEGDKFSMTGACLVDSVPIWEDDGSGKFYFSNSPVKFKTQQYRGSASKVYGSYNGLELRYTGNAAKKYLVLFFRTCGAEIRGVYHIKSTCYMPGV